MIKIRNLSVSFREPVFENLNCDFPDNGIFCIMATSGKGKTTFFNVIAGLIDYTGQVEKTGSVGYLFQNDRLLPWYSAKKNISLSATDTEKTEYYIKAFGIDEFEDKKVRELSGGMKRRCAIARCFAFDADIYLLDEPFRGLDDGNKQKVIDEIIKISDKKLCVVITHDKEDVTKLGGKTVELFS